MRTCPKCGASYPDSVQFCPTDGTGLTGQADDDPRVGTLVDRYRLVSRLGEGGMGIVYRAEHTVIGRPVALKLLHPSLITVPEAVDRFFREARAAGEVPTEHIVAVTDSGRTDDGTNFLVMELLSGHSLQAALEQEGSLDPARTIHIALQIAEALQAAHARGVVHRDLKPANVQLVERGSDPDFVKLLDFGVAKITESNIKLTQTGMIVGSPAYMSPEQASGKTVDHRTDIYAFGVILFEMLTGRIPFPGKSATEILLGHVSAPPPSPRNINPAIPPPLESIILACLAKDPGDRPQTMDELRGQLVACQAKSTGQMPASLTQALETTLPLIGTGTGVAVGEPEGPASLTLPTRRRPIVVGSVAAVLLLSGLAVGLLLFRRDASPPVRVDAATDTRAAIQPDSAPTVDATSLPDSGKIRKTRTRRRPRKPVPTPIADEHADDRHKAEEEERKRKEAARAAAEQKEQEEKRRREDALRDQRRRFEIRSEPSNALVYQAGKPLGRTPLVLDARQPRSLVLVLGGFHTQRVEIGPRTPSPVLVRMKPLGDPARSFSRLAELCRSSRLGPLECSLRKMRLTQQRDGELAEARDRYNQRRLSWKEYRELIDRIHGRYR